MNNLTIRSLKARVVSVPLKRPVIAAIGRFDTWSLVLIDIEFDGGIVGRSYVSPYRGSATPAIVKELVDLGDLLKGQPAAPVDAYDRTAAALNTIGEGGISLIARAGLDMALWDGLARAANRPLVEVLGGTVGSFRAYNSNGLWRHDPNTLAQEAAELLESGGFSALKLRLGYEHLADDLRAIRAVREGVGGDVDLMVDFNQSFGVGDALRRLHELDDEGLYWYEEPIDYSDVRGYAALAQAVRTPLQAGENFYGPRDFFSVLNAGGVHYAMADLERIGGVTGWVRAAGLAAAAGVQLSNHLYPEFSVHLLRATATAHWLEWVDWADPIMAEPLRPVDGRITVPDKPGSGIEWDEDAVAGYLVHEESTR
ncbi:enolase C-terminal domain-like protein [Protaetiibacter intestinalis]|uniref:Mandelate racemase n=1 Tax=Protaetiibacter intestinalis TaxID=2419774 RepID=A0A387B7Q9_9MICO|nr:enolase C-terminal domain-like protein [Protaetiibacter intestinalis]AYF97225.1 mandelate racemase [Protaetiibacter intestinalis]